MSEKLTKRELEILYLIANGQSNSEIAAVLFLSPHTIKVIVTRILRKLNSKNRAQAVFQATYTGLLKNRISSTQGFKHKV